ncbi:hypothetical protein [Sphingomonas oligophenolica]|uniref:Uncharacterized protein n=1 Tax=Sphingomonas oligophenolica TaxID=301154 RepID=A0A502CSS2_9SPHN|nr:hypothetical protein [Sphingomonas oligophenolica]TPG15560.1 hypothetical protein EAH84_01825 [Sphingomonas oligophenolica]
MAWIAARSPTDIPPSRYRIVERGRRLEVIDTRPGGTRARAGRPEPMEGGALPRLSTVKFDGTSELLTARWFDDHGPRRVTLTGETLRPVWVGLALGVAILIAVATFFPMALIVIPVVGGTKPRAALRSLATGWLDRNGA